MHCHLATRLRHKELVQNVPVLILSVFVFFSFHLPFIQIRLTRQKQLNGKLKLSKKLQA